MLRRNFLKTAGSAGVIIAAGSIGFAATRTPTAALKPWSTAGSLYTDSMRRALSFAILAPNPHNRQPWTIDLLSDTEAVLTCDLDRMLPATDPYSRQIVIGLGCFLELFSLAAADQGYRAEIRYFPEGSADNRLDSRPIAHMMLKPQNGLAGDPLFAQTLKRHTNRAPYDTGRPIDPEALGRLETASTDQARVSVTNNAKKMTDLRTLTRDAMRAEMRTPEAHQESVNLIRIGRTEIEANPDGISLSGAFLEALSLTGVLTRETLADPESDAYRIGIDMSDEGAMTSMGFVWIATVGNDRSAQVEAGRAYMRMTLQAAADDLAVQPMSQALQEYNEMTPYFDSVHGSLTDALPERVQMLARLGYASDRGPAPRWPLATRLKHH
jgi:hypothetical protein